MAQVTLPYNKKRTDNIEVLFKALYYLELADQDEVAITSTKEQLTLAFNAFPVKFNTDKQASRESKPFTYHENGVVTFAGNKEGEQVMLDAWEPEARPKTVAKKNVKQSYNSLYNISPIWYAQLMMHENRKLNRRRSLRRGYLSSYMVKYRENQIMRELPNEEQKQVLTDERESDNSSSCRNALSTFDLYFGDVCRYGEDWGENEFFFLNSSEIQKLAHAMSLDKVGQHIRAHGETPYTRAALQSIVHTRPGNRVFIQTDPLKANTRLVDANVQHYFPQYVLNHETVWRDLHSQYLTATDEQLATLRALDLLDDQLFQEIIDAHVQKEAPPHVFIQT